MKNPSPKKIHNYNKIRRNRVYFGIVLLMVVVGLFFIFLGRFSYIVASGKLNNINLKERTNLKYQQDRRLTAVRGTIYDANHNVIAEDSNVYNLYAVIDSKYVSNKNKPLYVKDKAHTAAVLSQYIPLSKAKIYGVLNNQDPNAFQVEFGNAGKNLSLEVKNEIEAKHLPGIYFTKSPSRLYPNGNFASHIVGLAQLDNSKKASNGTLVGVMGIESYFNKVLTGKNGVRRFKTDSYGYELPDSPVTTKKPKNGQNITLTLDSRLQSYMESTISDVYQQYAPVKMTATLMNAKTGKILAATQRPTFNPATKAGLDGSWQDALVQEAYEPGSVFKLLSLSAAIDSGHYTPNAYYQSGAVNVSGNVVRDWNYNGWGSIPFSQAFPRSSNVGFVKIEQQMGAKTWLDYLNRFGINKKTGITLPGEASGSLAFKRPLDQAITSFGQGVNVTVMQMMQAFSAVANNGKMVKPQIVSEISDPTTGKTTKTKTQVTGKPISKNTAISVRNAMKDVINQSYGTGQVYAIPGYDIGVKTGTAQIAQNGAYLAGDSNYIFSVVGMAPIDDPQYILYITMQQPQKMTKPAEQILASAFNPIMKRALEYNTDQKAPDVASITMPALTGQALTEAETKLNQTGLTYGVVGSGDKVVQQLPLAKENVLAGQRTVLLTNGAMTMPDVKGWSKNDVLKLAEITGVKVKFKGDGYVVSQSIPANHILNTDSKLEILLSSQKTE
ncbi:penicillin-binding protein [Lactobacillus sp. CC-MHH1034]|uniref:penicillin-binding protein n=1 Tax=Agrilactobacillus fermenti TaxID=2586909 RepID=UPI001E300C61|nr:penicillin-binding protein [Agrilactobacillus fermenti]MCD2255315.1 penicillin-binding protein [Agrilactobacillus fermenti]